MASNPITSWQKEREKAETVTDFIFLSSQITAYNDYIHEIEGHLFLGKKSMTNLDCVLKSRDITLPEKVYIIKAIVFPVVTDICEFWSIKKAEHWRIDVFELWCWRILRVPWNAKRSNQSILKEINPQYLLDELMLKIQYFGQQIWGADLLEKTWMMEKIAGKGRREWQKMRWLDSITDSVDMILSKFWQIVDAREICHAATHGVAKNWIQCNYQTTREDLRYIGRCA